MFLSIAAKIVVFVVDRYHVGLEQLKQNLPAKRPEAEAFVRYERQVLSRTSQTKSSDQHLWA